ncbi:uncharacterized protein LOC102746445, partial [Leptonychotes weddellii]|uniref:40S ribosomal protein S7 n=1 Tax=Leptonychotes weddellii TaxID=9713 RepID=A0A7F8Q6E9_LEPWE
MASAGSCPDHVSQSQQKGAATVGGELPTPLSPPPPGLFLGLSRLRPLFSGSSGFSARTVPASSRAPSRFEELSRDLGLFLGRRSQQGEGHVQFEREDREAQWREAGRVRVRHLPGEGGRAGAPTASQLRELNITAAKEIEVGGGRKAIIIFVPVPQLKSFQKIQVRLVRELEKKFSGKHVVFIAQRRILPKPTRKSRTKNKQKRPRSRTLTAVHDAILEDLVFPSEIVGKRIRVKLD